jgi:hypothetical protein
VETCIQFWSSREYRRVPSHCRRPLIHLRYLEGSAMCCRFSSFLMRVFLVLPLAGIASAADKPPAARPEGAPEPGQAIRLVGDPNVASWR